MKTSNIFFRWTQVPRRSMETSKTTRNHELTTGASCKESLLIPGNMRTRYSFYFLPLPKPRSVSWCFFFRTHVFCWPSWWGKFLGIFVFVGMTQFLRLSIRVVLWKSAETLSQYKKTIEDDKDTNESNLNGDPDFSQKQQIMNSQFFIPSSWVFVSETHSSSLQHVFSFKFFGHTEWSKNNWNCINTGSG